MDEKTKTMAGIAASLQGLKYDDKRLAELAAEVGGDGRAFATEENARLERAANDAERDLAHARESIVRLTLRLEVFGLRTSHESLDGELTAFVDEIDTLLNAREEVERVT